ncbi:MAG TPA: amidohydrolase [Azospirillaceae bacterium]|nr:amidohydrolase [Azospirillaceae bacterium]
MKRLVGALVLTLAGVASALAAEPVQVAAAPPRVAEEMRAAVRALEPKIVSWRRDIHQNPELSNREFRTSKLVADHLRALGLEVRTGIAHTGVVGVLRGAKPGPVLGLRADMDALPVTEQVDLPFASKVRTSYNGQEVGVMHACGHDGHVAILMGVAELLAGRRAELKGTVMFIFQPAEEGAPAGEEGGAKLMIKEGLFAELKPEAVFGLHLVSTEHAGKIAYRPGPAMASSDSFKITVTGRQTHGAAPWRGVDPIVTASQIVLGLQTIVSRQIEIVKEPAVVTVGAINGGVRSNIIPDKVELIGTIRTFDAEMRQQIHRRVEGISRLIAESAGATAEVKIDLGYPVVVNDGKLADWAGPVLAGLAGADNVGIAPKRTGSEDFSYYQEQVPGFFFWVGATPPDVPLDQAPANHSPLFRMDERALRTGAEALAGLALAWLER